MSACVSTQSSRATIRTAALLASWNTIPLSARTLCLAIQAPPLCLSRYCRVVFDVPNSVECLECVGLLGELTADVLVLGHFAESSEALELSSSTTMLFCVCNLVCYHAALRQRAAAFT